MLCAPIVIPWLTIRLPPVAPEDDTSTDGTTLIANVDFDSSVIVTSSIATGAESEGGLAEGTTGGDRNAARFGFDADADTDV